MSLFRVVYVRSKRTEDLLERIAIALEKLVPPVTEVGEIKIEEISSVLDEATNQERLDEQPIPEY